MTPKRAAYRIMSLLFPNRAAMVSLAKRIASKLGVAEPLKEVLSDLVQAQVEAMTPQLLEKLRREAQLEETRAHIDDVLKLIELRWDRLFRELAKDDPKLAFEPRRLDKAS